MRGCFSLVLAIGLLVASPLRADVVEPGVRYPGAVRLEVPQVGASLQVPKGWVGALGSDGKSFVMGSKQLGGVIVVRAMAEASLESVETMFARPIRLDAKTTLRPRGKPSVEDGLIKGDFTARVSGAAVVGHGQSYLLRADEAITLIGIGPPERAQQIRDMVVAVRGSVRVLESGSVETPDEGKEPAG